MPVQSSSSSSKVDNDGEDVIFIKEVIKCSTDIEKRQNRSQQAGHQSRRQPAGDQSRRQQADDQSRSTAAKTHFPFSKEHIHGKYSDSRLPYHPPGPFDTFNKGLRFDFGWGVPPSATIKARRMANHPKRYFNPYCRPVNFYKTLRLGIRRIPRSKFNYSRSGIYKMYNTFLTPKYHAPRPYDTKHGLQFDWGSGVPTTASIKARRIADHPERFIPPWRQSYIC